MRISLLAPVFLLLLGACDGAATLNELRATQPVGDPYQAGLAEGYKATAQADADAQDWEGTQYFASKGLMAARGTAITPEDPDGWAIADAAHAAELTQARARLVEVMEVTRNTQPALTSQAVVAYDRWLRAASEQNAGMAMRKQEFFAALGMIEVAQSAQSGTYAPVSEPGVAQAIDGVDERGVMLLYFPFDSDVLGEHALAALDKVVGQLKAAPKVTLAINGHADREGTEPYNMDLSQRRALSVVKALKKAGVPDARMHYFAFGETDPAVPTEDGVREPRNRRVEIVGE